MNEPAFPSNISNDPTVLRAGLHEGMSLRDYFAAKAMQETIRAVLMYDKSPMELAKRAYEYADAMIVERERKP